MEKCWNIGLNSPELTIIKIDVEAYVKDYKGWVFTQEELQSALKAVNNPIHRML